MYRRTYERAKQGNRNTTTESLRGFESARGYREGTRSRELLLMADGQSDFTVQAIDDRTEKIIDSFMDYLGANGLLLLEAPSIRTDCIAGWVATRCPARLCLLNDYLAA